MRSELDEKEAELADLQTSYDGLMAGHGYTIKDPTYKEMMSFISDDDTDKAEYIVDEYECTDFATRSYSWAKNPATNEAWTWEEIDTLQAGVSLMGRHDGPVICTQVYVKVNYEFVQTQGAVPLGNLFDILPHPNYTGDLLVKLYLTNTSDLLKAYQYINMKLYVEGSLEAEEIPAYQILSMENGVAFFNMESGSAESYTIKIIGGSYRLISGDIADWGEGWSIVPELYCEVSQR